MFQSTAYMPCPEAIQMQHKQVWATLALAVAGCSSTEPDMRLSWPDFVARAAGLHTRTREWPHGTAVQASDANAPVPGDTEIRRFVTWCNANSGRAMPDVMAAKRSADAVSFHNAVTKKGHAYQASGGGWRPMTSNVCVSAADISTVLAAMATEQAMRVGEVSWRVYFSPEQARQFTSEMQRREQLRLAWSQRNWLQVDAIRDAETSRLRSAPRIGDWTDRGLVVEIRPPLVLIEPERKNLAMQDMPPFWMRIEELRAQ